MPEPVDTSEVYKGDTAKIFLPGHQLVDGTFAALVAGYTCRVLVPGSGIDKTLTAPADVIQDTSGNDRFHVFLEPSETDTLTVDTSYKVIMQIENGSLIPKLSKEVFAVLNVIQGAAAPTV